MLRAPLVRKPQPGRTPAPILRRKCARCGSPETAGPRCSGCERKIGLQRRLAIGAANDPAEREADRAADQALRGGAVPDVAASPATVSRDGGDGSGGEAPPRVHSVLAQSGRPLGGPVRHDMEMRFGRDFSRVRLHDGAEAGRSAREVGASAYTVGSHIVFGAGRSPDDRRLLAHELAHVVQQDQREGPLRREVDADSDEAQTPTGGLDSEHQPAFEQPGEQQPEEETTRRRESGCTRQILFEGSCQHLVNAAAARCCDPDNGLSNPARSVDVDGNSCPSHKFTPRFTCDINCPGAVATGCSDSDHWLALPSSQWQSISSSCNTQFTICANGQSTHGYVRDRSDRRTNPNHFEVGVAIQSALGVTGSFMGAVYRATTPRATIDADPCCRGA